MAKGEFGMLYLCVGKGGGAVIFSFDNSLRGGVRKKNLGRSGGASNERKK